MNGPQIVGHRGFGKGVVDGHAENTISAVLAAAEAGAEWIEIDVRRTGDDDLVVLHNPTCETGVFVGDLASVVAHDHGLLELRDLLDALPPGIGLDIDIKSSLEDATRPRAGTTAALVAPIAAAESGKRQLLVTSFDAAALLTVRELATPVPVGLLTWVGFPLRKAIPMAAHLGFDALIAHVASFGPNQVDPAPVHRARDYSIRVAHDAGLAIGAWCPEPEAGVDLLRSGADLLVVNDVAGTLAAVRAQATKVGGRRLDTDAGERSLLP